MSLDAFEHILRRVVAEGNSSARGPPVAPSRSKESEGRAESEASGERVPSVFAVSEDGTGSQGQSGNSKGTTKSGKPGKNLIKSWQVFSY